MARVSGALRARARKGPPDSVRTDYQFGIIELRLNAQGEGEGATIPAARLAMNDEGQVDRTG